MPGGSKYGERRPQARRTSGPKKGYGKSEFAKLVKVSPSWIGELAKRGSILVLDDGSLDKDSAHAYFPEEVAAAGLGAFVPEESKRLVDEVLQKTNREIKEVEAKLVGAPELPPLADDPEIVYNIEKSRARFTYMQSELLRVKIEQQQGLSINRADATRTMLETYHLVNQSLLSLPSRLTDLVVGLDDPREVKDLIRSEVESIIHQLNNSIRELIEESKKVAEFVDELEGVEA